METNPSSAEPRIFATTHWSVVLAVQDEDPARAQAALEEPGDLHDPKGVAAAYEISASILQL